MPDRALIRTSMAIAITELMYPIFPIGLSVPIVIQVVAVEVGVRKGEVKAASNGNALSGSITHIDPLQQQLQMEK